MSISIFSTQQNSQQTPQILVVEDDPDALIMTAEYLQSNGYEVVTSPSAEKGLALVKKAPHGNWILVTDLELGRMDGKGLLERLVFAEVLILGAVVVSANPRLSEVIRSTQAGYQILGIPVVTLEKPFPMQNLLLVIAEIWASSLRTTRIGQLRRVTHLHTGDPGRILKEARTVLGLSASDVVTGLENEGESMTLDRYLAMEEEPNSRDQISSATWAVLCEVLKLHPEVLVDGYDARFHLEAVRGAIRGSTFGFPVSRDLQSRLELLEQIENCPKLNSKGGRSRCGPN